MFPCLAVKNVTLTSVSVSLWSTSLDNFDHFVHQSDFTKFLPYPLHTGGRHRQNGGVSAPLTSDACSCLSQHLCPGRDNNRWSSCKLEKMAPLNNNFFSLPVTCSIFPSIRTQEICSNQLTKRLNEIRISRKKIKKEPSTSTSELCQVHIWHAWPSTKTSSPTTEYRWRTDKEKENTMTTPTLTKIPGYTC